MSVITGLLLLGITLIFANMNINIIGFNSKDSSHFAFAQVNSPNGSSTTIIGNVKIPPTSNETKTTLSSNATGTNATGVHKANLAENITSASALTKENITTPISPTGISTQSRHVPPSNQNIK